MLHLVGGLDAAEHAGDPELAAVGFSQALALAVALEMRPLEARCRLGLGALYRRAGRPELARDYLTRAVTLFRAMEIRAWLPSAESLLAELG